MQRTEQHEEVQVVNDGTFEITVTPWLRRRFQAIKERNDIKFADKGGGLSRASQHEMFRECEFKEARVLELMHWLGRENGVRTDSEMNERIKLFSTLSRKYSVRIVAGQDRARREAVKLTTPAPAEELVTA